MDSIYMDNAASTKINDNVLSKFVDVATTLYGNPSSKHTEGLLASECIDATKALIGSKFGCDENDVLFTSGATMSNNLLIQGVLRKSPETMFITTSVEHNDIMELYDWLPYSKHMIGVDKYGFIDYNDLYKQLVSCQKNNKPCLVSVQMANSETGVIQSIKFISNMVHKYNGLLHMDATQYIPYYPIDMKAMGIDAISMSGQKIGGIKGSGLLIANEKIRNAMAPIIFGEQGIIGGTPSTPLISSLGEAVSCINYDTESLRRKTMTLLSYLEEMGGVIVGDKYCRIPNNIYIRFPGVDAITLMNLLNEYNIYVGTGSACSTDNHKPSHVSLAYGLTEDEALQCIRFTLSDKNTYDEIEYVANVVKGILFILRKEV